MSPLQRRYLRELRRGDHLCPVHETLADQTAFLAAVIEQGLLRGEQCLYVMPSATASEMSQALDQLGIDVECQQSLGSLRLLTSEREAFFPQRNATPSEIIEYLQAAEAAALRSGFRAVRFLGELSWALGPTAEMDTLIELEMLLNRYLTSSSSIVCCQYQRLNQDPSLMHDVLRTHPWVVLEKQAWPNPYYEPPELLAGPTQTAAAEFKHRRAAWWSAQLKAVRETERQREQALDEARRNSEALRRSEESYRQLIESIPHMVWMTDPQGMTMYLSPRGTEVLGIDAETAYREGWLNIVHPEDVENVRHVWYEALRSGRNYANEYRMRCADGSYRLYRSQGSPLRSVSGEIEKWVGTWTDIDDSIRVESELRRTDELLRVVANATPDAVFVKDLTGRYLLFNPAAARFVGKPAEEVIGRDDTEIFPPEQAQHVMERDRRVMTTGQAETEEEVLMASGGQRLFLATKTPYRDGNGSIIGVIGISRDITDWRQVEANLYLRDRAIQAVTQGILITDPRLPDNPIVFAGAGFERLTGYSPDEAVGRNCRFLQGKDTDPDTVAQLSSAIREHRPCAVEILNYRKDGTSFWNELFISPVHDEQGQLIQFIGVMADVTQRRLLEDQLRQSQKMEAVGQLAGGIAHDFNNLLTIINGHADLLLDPELSKDTQQELIEEIKKAGERSTALTRQLLAFSRKQLMNLRVIDLNDVVRDTERMLLRVLGENILLLTCLDPQLGQVKADPGQIEQILVNLAVNARDAMPSGGTLTIETNNIELDAAYTQAWPDLRPGRYVQLVVSDTGIGMSEEVRTRIFEPFFTTKGQGKGTGLGLPVVHGIVKQSEGEVEIQSQPGQGTSFKIYLPSVVGQNITPSMPAEQQTSLPFGSETILLAEDDDGVRALTCRVLESCGYTVLTAAHGEEALAAALDYPQTIDLLVTDVVMPGMGGRHLAECLCQQRPQVKVLYQSGYTDDEVVRHGVLQEEVDFLPKPFTPWALAQKVRQVLDGI